MYRIATQCFAFGVVGLLNLATPSYAGDCPGNPDAIGTARTVTVKPSDFPLVGKLQYMETIRLKDREVVDFR